VYRGSEHSDWQGAYITGDYCSGLVWAVNAHTGTVSGAIETGTQISSFAEDAAGEIYLVDYNGTIFAMNPAP
ncbi:MAG TPA: hypothetical protein PK819_02980, partial [Thermomicrobiales bacterium]|nr:hypothetical protein [Thermomicrobiales bacterium]